MTNLEQVLNKLASDKSFTDNVTQWEIIKSRKGKYSVFPEGIDPVLKKLCGKEEYQSFIHIRQRVLVLLQPERMLL